MTRAGNPASMICRAWSPARTKSMAIPSRRLSAKDGTSRKSRRSGRAAKGKASDVSAGRRTVAALRIARGRHRVPDRRSARFRRAADPRHCRQGASAAVDGCAERAFRPGAGAARACQCPASLCRRRADLRILPDRCETGDRKSSADREAMRGVVRDRQARALGYDFQYADWRIRHGAWSAQEASIKRRSKLTLQERTEALRELGQAPRPPLKPERIISDLTTEGILKMFGEALPSLGVFTAEGAVVTGGYSMRDENVAATGGTLSALWDGERTSQGARRRGSHDRRWLSAQLASDAAAGPRHRLDQQHGPDRPGPVFPRARSSGREA